MPWCYTIGGGWGNCHCTPTCGGTAQGRPCMFPFTYGLKTFQSCTEWDHDQPWCYAEGGGWGNCHCPVEGKKREQAERKVMTAKDLKQAKQAKGQMERRENKSRRGRRKKGS